MRSTFYKKYFEIQLYHQYKPEVICESFGITPGEACLRYLQDHNMGYKAEPGKILIYYSGKEVLGLTSSPPLRAMELIPPDPVPDGTQFIFLISVLDPDIINHVVVPDAIDFTYYSPPGNNYSPPYTDEPAPIPRLFIKPYIVSLQFPEVASMAHVEDVLRVSKLSISSIHGIMVSTEIMSLPVFRNDLSGNFNCSVDMSLQENGEYTFKLDGDSGSLYEQQFYVDVTGETKGMYGIFRLIKNYLQFASPPDFPNWGEPSPPFSSPPDLTAIDLQRHHIYKYTFPAPP